MSRKAVFDAMVFLQAGANPAGPSGACLAHVRAGSTILITSPGTLAELRGLLARPNIRKKFPHLTDEVAEEFLREIERTSTSIEEVPHVFDYPRGPKDEPYINLAIAAQADYLTSRDKDLLDLMHDPDFTARFPGIRVLDPVALLREIETVGESGQARHPYSIGDPHSSSSGGSSASVASLKDRSDSCVAQGGRPSGAGSSLPT